MIPNNQDHQDPFIIIQSLNSILDHEDVKNLTNNSRDWTLEEHFRYMNFLKQQKYIFSTTKLRKHYRVFKMMQNVILTRTSRQIKSHHQKLILKYKNLQTIIQTIEEYIRWMVQKRQNKGRLNKNSSLQSSEQPDLIDIISVQQIQQMSLSGWKKTFIFNNQDSDHLQLFKYHNIMDSKQQFI